MVLFHLVSWCVINTIEVICSNLPQLLSKHSQVAFLWDEAHFGNKIEDLLNSRQDLFLQGSAVTGYWKVYIPTLQLHGCVCLYPTL